MGENSTRWLKNTPLAPIAAPVDGVSKQKLAVEKMAATAPSGWRKGMADAAGLLSHPSSRDSVIPLTVR